MKPLTTDCRLKPGAKLVFLPHDGTNQRYHGVQCTVVGWYSGEDEVSVQIVSPYDHTSFLERSWIESDGAPRFGIVGASGFGQWIKERGL